MVSLKAASLHSYFVFLSIHTLCICAKGYALGHACVCVCMCVCVCVKLKMLVYILNGHMSLQKDAFCLLIHFICRQKRLLDLLSHKESAIISSFLFMQLAPQGSLGIF